MRRHKRCFISFLQKCPFRLNASPKLRVHNFSRGTLKSDRTLVVVLENKTVAHLCCWAQETCLLNKALQNCEKEGRRQNDAMLGVLGKA